MARVELTVLESKCRGGYVKKGEEFIVEDVCPPICHELWNSMYPMIYTLLNDGTLDYGAKRAKEFTIACPDGGRVVIHGEAIEE